MNDTTTGAVELPAPGEYRIDKDASTISFTTKHMFGLGTVRGTFGLREGHIHVADPVTGSSARATVSANSFHTGVSARDVTVRSGQYLDAEHHPDIAFASTGLAQEDGGWVLRGTLTVRGRGGEAGLRIGELRQDGARLTVRASCRVDRYAFGITAMKGMTGRYLDLTLDVTAGRE